MNYAPILIRDIALKSRKTKEDYIMDRVEKFLKEAETYYLATLEGD